MKKIQLTIPEPCHEKWDAMTPTQQGRYCNACAKEVIDFSNMSDSEVLNYFNTNKKGDVCGRAFPDQLNRTIAAPVKKKWYWYWQYAAAMLLFFFKADNIVAQKKVTHPVTASPGLKKKMPRMVGEVAYVKRSTVSGRVIDTSGNAVPYASIQLQQTQNGVSADENGQFSITIEGDTGIIEVSRLGYIKKEISVKDTSGLQITLAKSNELLQEVVLAQNLQGRLGGISIGYRISKRSVFTDTIKSWINIKSSITIYPNPVETGNVFTISMQLKKAGVYTIQVADATGRLLTENKITAAVKELNEQVITGSNWSAGICYVKVIDEKGITVSTGSVLLQ